MNKTIFIKEVITIGTLIALPSSAAATPAVPVPGDSVPAEEGKTAEKIENAAPVAESVETDTRFTLAGITVEHGDMKLSDKAMTKGLKEYIGREIGKEELNKAVGFVTAYARKHGYPAAAAYIPNQTAVNRKLTINIEPGRYGKIKLDNESGLRSQIAKGIINGLKEGDIIKKRSLETALYNLRDLFGVEAIGILSPGDKPGTSNLTVRMVDGKKNSLILYAENYGNQSAGRYRYGLQEILHNSFDTGEKINLGFLVSNQRQHNYNINYEMPIGHSAAKAGIGFSRSDYEPGNVFRTFGAKGRASTYSLYGRTPIWNTFASSFFVTYGYNYRDITDELTRYNFSWKKHSHAFNVGAEGVLRGKTDKISYNVNITTGTLTPTSAAAELIADAGGTKGHFTKGTFDLVGVHEFGKGFDVMMKLSGQKSANNLDSSEHIYLGGAHGVRAYPQGEASGDEGIIGSAEFRYHTPLKGLTLSIYYDAGHVRIGKSGGEGNMTLKGWGLGLAYTRPGDLFARLDYASRIGSDELMSQDAKSRRRIWFMIGKIF